MNNRPTRGRTRIAWIVTGVAAAVVAVLYGVGFAMAGDRAPRNASVGGVPIGGQSRVEAAETLRRDLAETATRPLAASLGDRQVEIEPADAGLAVDYAASVEAAGVGGSANPVHIWRVLTGGADVDPVRIVDQTKLGKTIDTVAEEIDTDVSDAAVSIDDGSVRASKARAGIVVDRPGSVQAVQNAYLRQDSVALKGKVTEPGVSTQEAERAAKEAKTAIGESITVDTGGSGRFTVSGADIAAALSYAASDGKLVAKLDEKKLRDRADTSIDGLDIKRPRDARWKVEGDKITVVPAVDGTEVSRENLAKAVAPVLTKTGKDRQATVSLTGAKADFTTEEAEKIKPSQVVGEFTTYYPHAAYRNVNLGQVAKRINGYSLQPGKTFSMNSVVGERNSANGYVDGYVIQGGVLKKESGGGVSQGATTIYNAAFFAGLEDVEHHPHTLYFDRYPAGREATVYYGSLDLRFKNNTDQGVVVTASRKPSSPGQKGSLTVKIWSNKVYDKIVSPEPTTSNYTSGRRVESARDDCEYQAPIKGFDARYYRSFVKDGKEVKRENYFWRYAPGDEIVCES